MGKMDHMCILKWSTKCYKRDTVVTIGSNVIRESNICLQIM